ncbi:MAG TPA: hypothetical protein VMG12_15150 [Polyangiaceae bacterium]|nr:hypothetical protein [Polyangiaceae bacterium]
MSSVDVFDVGRFTFGLPSVESHVHRNLKVPETISAQQRLSRKWEARRELLHAATRMPPEVTRARQLERVSALVDHAFATHPFYHRIYRDAGFRKGDIVSWADYRALPTVTKQDVIAHAEEFERANIAPAISECYRSTTSGSSGQVLTAAFDSAGVDEDMLLCLRFYEQMLGRRRQPSEWMYLVYLACPPFTSLDGSYPTFTISNECSPADVVEHLRRLRPALLSGMPSYLERLADLVDDPRELGLRAINTNSEASTVAQRRRIAERLGAPVFDEYSSVELALIATQCSEGRYHLVEDGVRVDVLNDDGAAAGEIVATSLFNTFMPFIRYRQGDVIQIDESSTRCACGSSFRYLASFQGRTDQVLMSKVIGRVPPDQVMALYDRTFLTGGANVAEFQIVQRELDRIQLILVPADRSRPANPSMVEAFTSGLRDLFFDRELAVVVEQRDVMPEEKSYKRRLIKCELGESRREVER